LPVFSPVIGIFGYSKPIAKIANDLRAIGIFGNGKTNCQSCQCHLITAPPGTRHQAWIVMAIRSVNRSAC
jgi:hypothetical protein